MGLVGGTDFVTIDENLKECETIVWETVAEAIVVSSALDCAFFDLFLMALVTTPHDIRSLGSHIISSSVPATIRVRVTESPGILFYHADSSSSSPLFH